MAERPLLHGRPTRAETSGSRPGRPRGHRPISDNSSVRARLGPRKKEVHAKSLKPSQCLCLGIMDYACFTFCTFLSFPKFL